MRCQLWTGFRDWLVGLWVVGCPLDWDREAGSFRQTTRRRPGYEDWARTPKDLLSECKERTDLRMGSGEERLAEETPDLP